MSVVITVEYNIYGKQWGIYWNHKISYATGKESHKHMLLWLGSTALPSQNVHHSLYNFHHIGCKPRKLLIILTDTDFTALINFLFSRIFSILLSCVGIKLDLNLMSRIQIPLLPASTMILYTIFSSLSPPFTFWAVEGSFSLYRRVPPWLNKSKYPWNKRRKNYPHTISGGEYVHRI